MMAQRRINNTEYDIMTMVIHCDTEDIGVRELSKIVDEGVVVKYGLMVTI